jgi:hypothetical protein
MLMYFDCSLVWFIAPAFLVVMEDAQAHPVA